ncbi:MAG: hypothetical protein WCI73_06260 [Phycisphaerae bacterium]
MLLTAENLTHLPKPARDSARDSSGRQNAPNPRYFNRFLISPQSRAVYDSRPETPISAPPSTIAPVAPILS